MRYWESFIRASIVFSIVFSLFLVIFGPGWAQLFTAFLFAGMAAITVEIIELLDA